MKVARNIFFSFSIFAFCLFLPKGVAFAGCDYVCGDACADCDWTACGFDCCSENPGQVYMCWWYKSTDPGTCDECASDSCINCTGDCCSGCFTGDTKIATPGGEKEIKDVKEGENVVSLNPETGERSEAEVEDIYQTKTEGYYEITVENPDGTESTLKVTGEHPLYVKRQDSLYSTISSFFQKAKQWLSDRI